MRKRERGHRNPSRPISADDHCHAASKCLYRAYYTVWKKWSSFSLKENNSFELLMTRKSESVGGCDYCRLIKLIIGIWIYHATDYTQIWKNKCIFLFVCVFLSFVVYVTFYSRSNAQINIVNSSSVILLFFCLGQAYFFAYLPQSRLQKYDEN
jgi:hypothetical protein